MNEAAAALLLLVANHLAQLAEPFDLPAHDVLAFVVERPDDIAEAADLLDDLPGVPLMLGVPRPAAGIDRILWPGEIGMPGLAALAPPGIDHDLFHVAACLVGVPHEVAFLLPVRRIPIERSRQIGASDRSPLQLLARKKRTAEVEHVGGAARRRRVHPRLGGEWPERRRAHACDQERLRPPCDRRWRAPRLATRLGPHHTEGLSVIRS